jgi:hypothetical protein
MPSDCAVEPDRVAAFANVVRHRDKQYEEARRSRQAQQ